MTMQPTNYLARRVPVLMYHAIGPAPKRGRFRRFVVPPALLTGHLDALCAAGYRVVSLRDLLAGVDSGDNLSRLVAITFDDGYADFLTVAIPLLVDRGFGATVYVPSAYVGRTAGWLARVSESTRAVMSWSALADVAQAGFEIGGHGENHIALDAVPMRIANREIRASRTVLEDALGVAVTTMAYPFGYQSAATRRLVKAAGYLAAVAVRYEAWEVQGDRFAISRLLIGPDHTPEALVALVDARSSAGLLARCKMLGEPAWRATRTAARGPAPRNSGADR